MQCLLLGSCGLLVLADSTTSNYSRWQDGYSWSSHSGIMVPTLVGCATACARSEEPTCEGFTRAENGSCQLFRKIFHSETTTPPVGTLPVEYGPGTNSGSSGNPCPAGWYFFRDSCYLRVKERLNWGTARTGCRTNNISSDLISVNEMSEVAWLLHHASRPKHSEFMGVRWLSGELINVDNTTAPAQMLAKDPTKDMCLRVRYQYRKDIRARECSRNAAGYVCESSTLCRSGAPCPDSWLGLDDFCYHYVSTNHTWRDADQHCTGLQPGARLAPIVNMATFRVLFGSFSPPSAVFVGLSDLDTEGEFQSVDGSAWNVTWHDGEPTNGNGEHCVGMDADGANDVDCTRRFPSICRVERMFC